MTVEMENETAALAFNAAERPELFHYTNLNGLNGILESNSLWATHFSQLNDQTEVMLLQRSVTKKLASRLKPNASGRTQS
jgi:hypothetical protein